MKQFLNLISSNDITMLKDIDNNIKINKIGQFKHFYIPNMEIVGINKFISRLEPDSVYIIIPIISMFAKDNDPIIILSKQILVSNNSSSKVIHEYLDAKLERAMLDFGAVNLEGSNYFQLIFKYKKVTFDFSKLP
jgi:hypothetical protein